MTSARHTLMQSALLLAAVVVSGCGHDSFPTTPTPLATAPVVLQGTRYQGTLTLTTGATTAFNMTLIARGLASPSSVRLAVQSTGPVTVTGSFETGSGLSGNVQGTLIGSLDDGFFNGSLTADSSGRTDEQQFSGPVTSSSAALVAGECVRGDCRGDGLGGAVQTTQATLGGPPAPACSYSLSPASASFAAAGGSATTTIATSPGCAWSAISTVPWITIVGAATGTGTGVLSYEVQANGGDARSGTVRAAVETLSVVQNPQVTAPPPPPPTTPTPPTAPTITAQPESRTIASGATAQLSVQATGTAPLTYQWYAGPAGTTANPMPGATGSSFTTPTLTTTTSYWVRVTNSVNHADSATATITVTTNPVPAITAEPQSQTITLGATATLSVTATSSTPLTYQWFTGASGTTTSPIAGATSGSYAAQPTTTTSYWVRVSNGAGPVNSATATVTVRVPPTITTQPQSQTILAGARATLSVAATGTAPFTYQWFTGTSGTTTNPVAGATAQTFTTPALTTTTSYWVQVSNGVGRVNSAAATLTVPPPGPPALTFAFSANPVHPDATPNSACPDFPRTWTYDLTITNAVGARPFTVSSWSFNFLSGQVMNFTVQQFVDFFHVSTPTIPSGGTVVGRLCVGSGATTSSLTHTFNGTDDSRFITTSLQLAAF